MGARQGKEVGGQRPAEEQLLPSQRSPPRGPSLPASNRTQGKCSWKNYDTSRRPAPLPEATPVLADVFSERLAELEREVLDALRVLKHAEEGGGDCERAAAAAQEKIDTLQEFRRELLALYGGSAPPWERWSEFPPRNQKDANAAAVEADGPDDGNYQLQAGMPVVLPSGVEGTLLRPCLDCSAAAAGLASGEGMWYVDTPDGMRLYRLEHRAVGAPMLEKGVLQQADPPTGQHPGGPDIHHLRQRRDDVARAAAPHLSPDAAAFPLPIYGTPALIGQAPTASYPPTDGAKQTMTIPKVNPTAYASGPPPNQQQPTL